MRLLKIGSLAKITSFTFQTFTFILNDPINGITQILLKFLVVLSF